MTQTEFTQRVLAMQDRLYRVSCTLLRCEADREDAVQSALEKAWRGRFLLRQEQYMETWLTRILINECYAIMRRSRRIIPMAEVGENQPAQWEAQNADEMLCRALTALPTHCACRLSCTTWRAWTFAPLPARCAYGRAQSRADCTAAERSCGSPTS